MKRMCPCVVLIHPFSESRKSHISQVFHESIKIRAPWQEKTWSFYQTSLHLRPKRRGNNDMFQSFTAGMHKCIINVYQILGCIISCWVFASSIMHTCRYKYPNVEVLLTSIFFKYRPFAFVFDKMGSFAWGVTKAIWILKIYEMPRVYPTFPPFIAWPSYKMLGFPWRFGGPAWGP